jgi:hypothetical protein
VWHSTRFHPPHLRSGAALYYIFSTGMFTADGKTDRGLGMAHYDMRSFISDQSWRRTTGDHPASINQEGVPAVMFVQPAGAGEHQSESLRQRSTRCRTEHLPRRPGCLEIDHQFGVVGYSTGSAPGLAPIGRSA